MALPTIYQTASGHLRRLRLAAGLTQQETAERAGLSISFLSYLEGARKQGSLETYAKLAGVLGCTLGELFAAPGRPTRRQPDLLAGLGSAERRAVLRLIRTLRRR